MNLFVFVADAWGPVGGGINSLNYDLVNACAEVAKEIKNTKICCVVPNLDYKQINQLAKNGIITFGISRQAFSSPEAINLIYENLKKKVRCGYPENTNTFYIGHDIYTGTIAEQLAAKYGGWSVVFHHMDYDAYYSFKKPDSAAFISKTEKQKEILSCADLIVAVGELLKDSAQDKAPEVDIMQFIPGIADFRARQKAPNSFKGVVFGRMEEDNQCIKQIPLSIHAFAETIRQDKECEIIGKNATLYVIGYEANKNEALAAEVSRLQKEAESIAGRACQVVPMAYQTDRKKLGEILAGASVVMMLSLHEGFGLVGYEAIAAGVPLILSENTGLYRFLKNNELDHLVSTVDIQGSVGGNGYTATDFKEVARVLRNIRQYENKYKDKALKLRNCLMTGEYSWKSVAKRFLQNILKNFEKNLKDDATVFYRPEELTKIKDALQGESNSTFLFSLSKITRVYVVEGKDALVCLIKCLRKAVEEKYQIFLYDIEDVGEDSSIDFLDSCRTFFGEEKDYAGPGFRYVLGERLTENILILNNHSGVVAKEIKTLFDILNKDNHDFYIFSVCETDGLFKIEPYEKQILNRNDVKEKKSAVDELNLTYEQKLLAKILYFRQKVAYSKRVISFICRDLHQYYKGEQYVGLFSDPLALEQSLLGIGLIEEYSEYSYRNIETLIPVVSQFNVNSQGLALGIAQLGRFYSRCYFFNRGRDQQIRWGYFACQCYAYAAKLSREIRDTIKSNYETILNAMRKKAIDTADYSRYRTVLQVFIDEYQKPDNLWIWYNLIHCDTICGPQKETLEKVRDILKIEFFDKDNVDKDRMAVCNQLIRLQAELEFELDVDGALEGLIQHCEKYLPGKGQDISWCQCVATIISLATNQKKYNLAKRYLEQYKKAADGVSSYPGVVATAHEMNLKIAQFIEGNDINLKDMLSPIKQAYYAARDRLKDYRAQGWIQGLWGECQMLLHESSGQRKIKMSMECRKSYHEKTKSYKIWLHRIGALELDADVRALLNQELERTNNSPLEALPQ